MPANKYEVFEVCVVERSDIQFAQYNPRIIRHQNKSMLGKSLRKLGFVQPVVWNVRSKNLVGGEQRICELDRLHRGSNNYKLTVCKIDVDDKKEREINIALNNLSIQGEYDFVKLEKLLTDTIMVDNVEMTLDIEAIGFTPSEIMRYLGSRPMEVRPEFLEQLSEQLKKNRETMEKIRSGLQKIDSQSQGYLVVVFRDLEERRELTNMLGWEDNRYQDGETLIETLRRLMTKENQ